MASRPSRASADIVNLAIDKYELLHRTAVFAPPVKPGEDRYELAANMLDFPNGGDFEPQAWVPREVAIVRQLQSQASESLRGLEDSGQRDRRRRSVRGRDEEHRRRPERPANQHPHAT